MKATIIKSVTSWRTTLIGFVLLLVSTGIWFIPTMPVDSKSPVSLMLIAAALTALGVRDETVFGKGISEK